MKLGSQDNVDSSPNQSLNGSFRKIRSGLSQNDLDLSPGHSVDGSFRMSNSVMSARSLSGISTSSKSLPTSRRVLKALKDYARTLLDLELFTQNLDDWVSENLDEDSNNKKQRFKTLFSIDELRMLDLALDGVLFQQLNRMPCSIYESDDTLRDEYLAIEEFLLAVVNGLWHTFWRQSGHFPFVLSCPRYPGSKFHTIEKAISRGRVDELCGLALLSKIESDKNVRWDQVVEFILFKEDILSGNEPKLSASVISEAFFYGVHILLARALRRQCTVGSDSVFILVFDSQFGAVVKLGGDLGKLDTNSTNPYHSVVEWIKCHAGIGISSVSQVWNKLGNPNWRDLGTLQVLLTTFTSMVQWNGQPKKSIAALASEHSVRLQKQRLQFKLVKRENALVPYLNNMHKVEIRENALVPYSNSMHEGEIQELEPSDNSYFLNQSSHLKFRHGEILLLDDQRQAQKGFQIQDSLVAGNNFLYTAVSLDLPEELLTLYAGAHPSKLEPSWEDMSMWYQVQRQTKVLNILREQGVASKYLPQITASGRLSHSGPCNKRSPSDCCDHPWCGMPILVTSPVGEPLSFVVAHEGPLSSEEAKRCCRDCLTALRSASVANIQHGDICPENILRVTDPQGTGQRFFYVPISWGRAVLEDRDSPAINIQFSSSHALQQGKLCPSSDAESLIYVLYFVSGGMMQQQDSIESALQWREKSWAKRVIQQQLGEVSPLLKAFTDYVDSLCGTPYPVDYDVWLKRLNRAVDGSADRGKMVEELSNLRLEDVAESSGASACGGVKLSSRIM